MTTELKEYAREYYDFLEKNQIHIGSIIMYCKKLYLVESVNNLCICIRQNTKKAVCQKEVTLDMLPFITVTDKEYSYSYLRQRIKQLEEEKRKFYAFKEKLFKLSYLEIGCVYKQKGFEDKYIKNKAPYHYDIVYQVKYGRYDAISFFDSSSMEHSFEELLKMAYSNPDLVIIRRGQSIEPLTSYVTTVDIRPFVTKLRLVGKI